MEAAALLSTRLDSIWLVSFCLNISSARLLYPPFRPPKRLRAELIPGPTDGDASSMNAFTYLFLAALLAGTLLQLWLLQRQFRHVRAHRAQVPARFADRVSAEEHRKAADYTLAKVRIGTIDLVLGAMVILGWTLGGGLAALAGLWETGGLGALGAGVGLILSFLLIGRSALSDA